MRFSTRVVFCCAAVLPLVFLQAHPTRADKQLSVPLSWLDSNNPREVAQAIEAIGKARPPKAIKPLAARIRRGLPPALLDKAIDAIVRIKGKPAGKILIELSSHRRPSVRARVAAGLATTRVAGGLQVLAGLLDDPSPEVRGAAIAGVELLDGRPIMPVLIQAAHKGIPGATEVLGKQVGPTHVKQLLGKLDADNLDRFDQALRGLLDRPDLPKKYKLLIVSHLKVFPDHPVSGKLLADLVRDRPKQDPLRIAAIKVLKAREQADSAGKK